MNDEKIRSGVDQIIALIKGESGPFLESDDSFFGRSNVTSDMKGATMQQDCGGMIVTKAPLTYGQADEIAENVDLQLVMNHIYDLVQNKTSHCYWKGKDPVYYGEIYWAIFDVLAKNNLIPHRNKELDYNNSMEYLYKKVLDRLVETKKLYSEDGRWYKLIFPNLGQILG